jgi:hypothetical protein
MGGKLSILFQGNCGLCVQQLPPPWVARLQKSATLQDLSNSNEVSLPALPRGAAQDEVRNFARPGPLFGWIYDDAMPAADPAAPLSLVRVTRNTVPTETALRPGPHCAGGQDNTNGIAMPAWRPAAPLLHSSG